MSLSATTLTDREAQGIDERRPKAQRLRARGENPYPHGYPDRTMIAALQAAHDPRALGPGERRQLRHRIAGRVVAKRGHGRTQFIDVRDVSGGIRSEGHTS